jgi:hypothetical protein
VVGEVADLLVVVDCDVGDELASQHHASDSPTDLG